MNLAIRTILAGLLLATLALANDWDKHVKGNVTVSVDPRSSATVELWDFKTCVKVYKVGIRIERHWERIASVAPGQSVQLKFDGTMRFRVNGRKHLSASDCTGGFDAHWEGVWLSLRHR